MILPETIQIDDLLWYASDKIHTHDAYGCHVFNKEIKVYFDINV